MGKVRSACIGVVREGLSLFKDLNYIFKRDLNYEKEKAFLKNEAAKAETWSQKGP